jgi:hypothetical protein
MTQFVEFTRFIPNSRAKDTEVTAPPSRISVNVAHVTAVITHSDSGTLLRFVGSGESEHVEEDYNTVMRFLNR